MINERMYAECTLARNLEAFSLITFLFSKTIDFAEVFATNITWTLKPMYLCIFFYNWFIFTFHQTHICIVPIRIRRLPPRVPRLGLEHIISSTLFSLRHNSQCGSNVRKAFTINAHKKKWNEMNIFCGLGNYFRQYLIHFIYRSRSGIENEKNGEPEIGK